MKMARGYYLLWPTMAQPNFGTQGEFSLLPVRSMREGYALLSSVCVYILCVSSKSTPVMHLTARKSAPKHYLLFVH